VQLLPSSTEQSPIGSILYQRVLEDERCPRQLTSAENQPGADELIERVL